MTKSLVFLTGGLISVFGGALASFAVAGTIQHAQRTGRPNLSGHPDRLVRLTNDRDAGFSDLNFLIESSGSVAGLEYATTEPSGQLLKKSFSPGELQSSNGAVLEEQRGVKAITVWTTLNEGTGQGVMRFRYIANGLTGVYKFCDVGLNRSGTGAAVNWQMMNLANHQPIVSAKILSWSLGISTLQGICP